MVPEIPQVLSIIIIDFFPFLFYALYYFNGTARSTYITTEAKMPSKAIRCFAHTDRRSWPSSVWTFPPISPVSQLKTCLLHKATAFSSILKLSLLTPCHFSSTKGRLSFEKTLPQWSSNCSRWPISNAHEDISLFSPIYCQLEQVVRKKMSSRRKCWHHNPFSNDWLCHFESVCLLSVKNLNSYFLVQETAQEYSSWTKDDLEAIGFSVWLIGRGWPYAHWHTVYHNNLATIAVNLRFWQLFTSYQSA